MSWENNGRINKYNLSSRKTKELTYIQKNDLKMLLPFEFVITLLKVKPKGIILKSLKHKELEMKNWYQRIKYYLEQLETLYC